MKLNELFEELDRYGVYGKPSKRRKTDGSASPLTGAGDASWKKAKGNIFNWFKRPFLTNGPRGNYMLPVKKKVKESVRSEREKPVIPANQQEQLNIVRNWPYDIQYLNNPSEEVQLAAVSIKGNAIHFIIDAGIIPSEQVQLTAVKNNGYSILNILEAGIIPSEQVRLAAVSGKTVYPIDKIPNELITSQMKVVVLKKLIETIKNNHLGESVEIYKLLRSKNIKWPELDIIEKTLQPELDYRKQRDR